MAESKADYLNLDDILGPENQTDAEDFDAIQPQKVETEAGAMQVEPSTQANLFPGFTPESAIADSPLSIADRVKTTFGNQKGNLNFLKAKYGGQAKYVEGKGLVVNDNGTWKQVDPDNLTSDPWSVSEFIADSAEFVATTVGPARFLQAASLVTGPAAPAAFITASAMGTAVNMSLGRYFGTYDAEPTEMMGDFALEATANALGLGFGKGLVKAGGATKDFLKKTASRPMFEDLFKGLANAGATMSSGTRQSMHALIGLTGASKDAAKRIVDKPLDVMRTMSKYLKSPAGRRQTTNEVIETMEGHSRNQATSVIKEVPRLLSATFDKMEKAVVNHPMVAKHFNANPRQILAPIMDTLRESNIIKISAKGVVEVGETFTKNLDDAIASGQANPTLANNAKTTINNFIKDANNLFRQGKITGSKGAKDAIDFRRKASSVFQDVIDSQPKLAKLYRPLQKQITNAVDDAFAIPGSNVGSLFKNMNSFYHQGQAVKRKAMQLTRDGIHSGKKIGAFLKSAFNDPNGDGKMMREMFNISGKVGKRVLNKIEDRHAASEFIKWSPNWTGHSGGTGATRALSLAGTLVASPRVAARSIGAIVNGTNTALSTSGGVAAGSAQSALPYMKQMRDFILTSSLKDKDEMLTSNTLFPQLIETTLKSFQGEQQETEALVQQAK